MMTLDFDLTNDGKLQMCSEYEIRCEEWDPRTIMHSSNVDQADVLSISSRK